MRTPKIEALQRLIIWLNRRANTNISLLPLDTSNLGCNSWLAGFSDADAYFQVSLPPQSGGQFGKIKCFYRLECQQNYHRESDLVDSSYLPIMQQIADYFNTKLVTRDRITNYGNSSTCFVYTTNLQSNTIVYIVR
jgi:hypothetical protein